MLFDYEKKSAEHYTELMEDIWKKGQPIITVIAKEKKSGQQDYNFYPFH